MRLSIIFKIKSLGEITLVIKGKKSNKILNLINLN